MSPVGSDLTLLQLADALLWKLSQVAESDEQTRPRANQLDVLEHKVSDAISAIRSIRNISSPVHRLPPEILGVIFQIVQDQTTPANYLPQFSDVQTHSLESVVCVCRRWRETALSIPSLWSLIYGGRDQFASTSLVRSASAPLKVYIRGTPSRRGRGGAPPSLRAGTTKLMESLITHSERIRELHLVDVEPEVVGSNLLLTRAPRLESLTISVISPRAPHLQPFVPFPTPPPTGLPTLFSGCTPNLRRLTFHGFMAWSTHIFKDLTHLTLSNQNPAHPLLMSQLLPSLAACPRLEELALVCDEPMFDTIVHPPVTLDYLRVLSIGSWFSARTVARFLSFLILPPGIDFFLWGIGHETDDDLGTIFPIPLSTLANMTQLRITHNPERYLGSFATGWDPDDNHHAVFLTPSTLQIDGLFQSSQVLLRVPQVFPLGGIEELWIGCHFHPDLTTEEWRGLFLATPSLKTLVITRRSSQPIISALSFSSNGNADNALLCPDLQTLRLYGDSSRSVLRLAILAEERMRFNRPIQFLQVIPSASPESRKESPELMSDLMYLERYIRRVEYVRVDTAKWGSEANWELLDSWPPPVYTWVPGERHEY